MILSAGLTPSWQQVMVFPAFRWGEVNRAAEVRWLAQGKVLNAGIAAHCLGGPSLTLATVGGPPAVEIDREFADLGVPRRWVQTKVSTRVCTTILDRATGVMTELVENGKPLTDTELDQFRSAFAEESARAAVVVIAGSLPTGVSAAYYRELVAWTKCPVVLDFRGDGLLETLDLKPLVVKPNREELGHTVGRELREDRDLFAAMRELNRAGAQWVVVTQGPGPVWVSHASGLFRLLPAPIEQVVNPIGSGDALAAGIAWAVRDGRAVLDAVKWGMAAAAENVQSLETCRLDPGRVGQLAKKVEVEQIEGHS